MEVRIQVSWDRSLETGDPEIDGQHRELFRRIDQLMVATQDRRARAEVGRLLTYLGDYVVSHFSAEERLMVEAEYPGTLAHREEHQRFVEEYARIFQDYRANGAGAGLRDQVRQPGDGLAGRAHLPDRPAPGRLPPSQRDGRQAQ